MIKIFAPFLFSAILLCSAWVGIPARGAEVGRRLTLGSFAALLSGAVAKPPPGEAQAHVQPEETPTIRRDWRRAEIGKVYSVLTGRELNDENLFFMGLKSQSPPSEIRRLGDAYRQAIVTGKELDESNSPIPANLRTRVNLNPGIHDKYQGILGEQVLQVEERLATTLGIHHRDVAQAVDVALNPQNLMSLALAGRLMVPELRTAYSEIFLQKFVTAIFALSPPLALHASRGAQVSVKEARRWVLDELRLREFPAWSRQYYRFVFKDALAIYDRDLHRAEPQATALAVARHYRMAIDKLERAKASLANIPESSLRSVSLAAVSEILAEMNFEWRTLPQRISAWRFNRETPVWASPRWTEVRAEASSENDLLITSAEWLRILNLVMVSAEIVSPDLNSPELNTGETASGAFPQDTRNQDTLEHREAQQLERANGCEFSLMAMPDADFKDSVTCGDKVCKRD